MCYRKLLKEGNASILAEKFIPEDKDLFDGKKLMNKINLNSYEVESRNFNNSIIDINSEIVNIPEENLVMPNFKYWLQGVVSQHFWKSVYDILTEHDKKYLDVIQCGYIKFNMHNNKITYKATLLKGLHNY